jgi:deoxyribose-phosphate aldolase
MDEIGVPMGKKMRLTTSDIAKMLDLSAVQVENDETSICSLVDLAKKYLCYSVIVLPGFSLFVKNLLQDEPTITLGGPVGFPSGGNTTTNKVFEARELIAMGCRELDMVINVGKLISKRFDEVREDIHAVVDSAEAVPVKVILECHYLNPDLIRTGCDLSIAAGARYIKTGTGWAPTGATLDNIALIKSYVGDAIKIKAAGGVRSLEVLLEMHQQGASRFGVSLRSGKKILEQSITTGDKLPL